jgi:hypothetical protein
MAEYKTVLYFGVTKLAVVKSARTLALFTTHQQANGRLVFIDPVLTGYSHIVVSGDNVRRQLLSVAGSSTSGARRGARSALNERAQRPEIELTFG